MSRISVVALAGSDDLSNTSSQPWLRRTLQQVAGWRAAGHEIIVVAADAAPAERQPWYQNQVDQCVSAPGSPANRMNAGAALATGDVLLFLQAGTRLPAEALTTVSQGLQQSSATWGRFDVQFDAPHDSLRWVERLANTHSRLFGVAVGEQAIFVRKHLFRLVGGFADIPILHDVDLSRRLKRHGRPLCLRERVLVDSQPWQQNGVGTRLRRMIGLRIGYFLGESPVQLYRREDYRGLAYNYYRDVAEGDQTYTDQNGLATAAKVPQYRYPAARVLLWAQAPILGEVKPHLQALLGRTRVLQLYRQLTRFVWSQIKQRHLASAQLWISEPGCEAFFDELCPRPQQFLQQGADQGAALLHAVTQTLTEAELALVVTADFVALDAAYLQWALQALDDGVRVVIGATDDGAWGLLGFRKPLAEELFTTVAWETDQALPQIRQCLQQAGVQWVELPIRWRLDTADDLKRLSTLHDWQSV